MQCWWHVNADGGSLHDTRTFTAYLARASSLVEGFAGFEEVGLECVLFGVITCGLAIWLSDNSRLPMLLPGPLVLGSNFDGSVGIFRWLRHPLQCKSIVAAFK